MLYDCYIRGTAGSCRLLDFIAVLAVQLSPKTMFDNFGPRWPAELADALARQPLWLVSPVLVLAPLLLVALIVDRRTLYTTRAPRWAMQRDAVATVERIFLHELCTRHSLLRVFCAVHTAPPII